MKDYMFNEVIFVDSSNSLHDNKIGGTNSIVRRIIPELSNAGYKVIFYDLSPKKAVTVSKSVDEYTSFNSILELYNAIKVRHQSIIIDVYLHPRQRIGYCIVRLLLMKNTISFRKIYYSYPKNSLKRLTSFLDTIISYDKVFVISDRQKHYLSRYFRVNAELIYPPIDDRYFNLLPNKTGKTFTICWVGRLDKGKGADLLFEILSRYINRNDVNIKIIAHSVGDENSVVTPHWVFNADNFDYQEVAYSNWSKDLDNAVHDCFRISDCFVSPYRALESTIDCPMLIQESSSAACTVITEDYAITRKLLNKTGILIESIEEDSEKIKAYQMAIDALISKHASKKTKIRGPLMKSFKASLVATKLLD
jgi:glycosyltransferase involved in cell wall biosynthesis